jgi:hypothetical protein
LAAGTPVGYLTLLGMRKLIRFVQQAKEIFRVRGRSLKIRMRGTVGDDLWIDANLVEK